MASQQYPRFFIKKIYGTATGEATTSLERRLQTLSELGTLISVQFVPSPLPSVSQSFWLVTIREDHPL